MPAAGGLMKTYRPWLACLLVMFSLAVPCAAQVPAAAVRGLRTTRAWMPPSRAEVPRRWTPIPC